MFGYIGGLFSADLAIDLGTSNTLVFIKNKGIVINEPTVVAVTRDGRHEEIVSVGREAKDMLGRTPGDIIPIKPVCDGVINHFEAASEMLRIFIQKAHNRKAMVSPRIIVCVPVGITEVEKRAVTEALQSANARQVYLIEQPMAAAVGAGMPITEPSGTMIVDIGGGTCEVAVISLGGIVFSKSLRIGGDKMDAAIIAFIKKRYSLLVGERTAEQIRIELGNAYPSESVKTMEVKGRDLLGGVPKTIEIDSDEVREALKEPVDSIVESVRISLEKTEPELASDIVERGIMLSGGGCLLHNLDVRLQKETGLKVTRVPNPLTGTVLGAGEALDNIDLLKQVTADFY